MSASTENRNDGGLGAGLRPHEIYMGWSGPIAAGAKIPNGTIAAATSLAPGSAISTFTTGASKIALGFVDAGWDNTGGVLGAHQIAVNQRTGTLIDLNAGGGSAIAAADARKICYLADNQTCSKLPGDGEAAGIIFGIDPATGRPVVGIGPLFLAMAKAAVLSSALTTFTQTYSTATATVAAATTSALTDSTGGTPGTTLAAITAGAAYAQADATATKNALATLAAQVNAQNVDVLVLRKLINQLIDILQASGLAL